MNDIAKIKMVLELHRAAAVEHIRTLLEASECIIKFTKLDGTERIARAARNPILAKPNSKPHPDIVVFWDLDKEAIRSCDINRLISVEVV